MLLGNERIDEVNDSLSLIQKPGGLLFGTDALLLAAYIPKGARLGTELGGGSGIISMLLLSRGKLLECDCIEAQEEYADLIRRNAELNSLSHSLHAHFADVRDFKSEREYDAVFTNPPYMKNDGGKRNESDAKNIARHEVFGDIFDFLSAAKRLLKFGGSFYAVYRPDRLTDLIVAMRDFGIEPKRISFVHADTESESSMVLIEGKRGGKPGTKLTKPLIIYEDEAHKKYTADMNYIMENGTFGDDFFIANKRKNKE